MPAAGSLRLTLLVNPYLAAVEAPASAAERMPSTRLLTGARKHKIPQSLGFVFTVGRKCGVSGLFMDCGSNREGESCALLDGRLPCPAARGMAIGAGLGKATGRPVPTVDAAHPRG